MPNDDSSDVMNADVAVMVAPARPHNPPSHQWAPDEGAHGRSCAILTVAHIAEAGCSQSWCSLPRMPTGSTSRHACACSRLWPSRHSWMHGPGFARCEETLGEVRRSPVRSYKWQAGDSIARPHPGSPLWKTTPASPGDEYTWRLILVVQWQQGGGRGGGGEWPRDHELRSVRGGLVWKGHRRCGCTGPHAVPCHGGIRMTASTGTQAGIHGARAGRPRRRGHRPTAWPHSSVATGFVWCGRRLRRYLRVLPRKGSSQLTYIRRYQVPLAAVASPRLRNILGLRYAWRQTIIFRVETIALSQLVVAIISYLHLMPALEASAQGFVWSGRFTVLPLRLWNWTGIGVLFCSRNEGWLVGGGTCDHQERHRDRERAAFTSLLFGIIGRLSSRIFFCAL